MSVFKTVANIRGENITFTRAPAVRKSHVGKGWVIVALSDDESLYNGQYAKVVGYAGDAPNNGCIAFRLKRDAVAAMNEAISLGILQGAHK